MTTAPPPCTVEASDAADGVLPDDGPGPLRRCIASGESLPREALIRFVRAPDGTLVPDLKACLPGRGLWLQSDRASFDRAIRKRLLARAGARLGNGPVVVPEDPAALVEGLLRRHCLDLMGLAKRAGQAVAGFDKVAEALRRGGVGVLLAAHDGAADGRGKLRALARGLPLIELFDAAELGLALGRENVIHAALAPGRLAEHLQREARRLAGFTVFKGSRGDPQTD